MMRSPIRISIIGAGMTGSLVACLLKRKFKVSFRTIYVTECSIFTKKFAALVESFTRFNFFMDEFIYFLQVHFTGRKYWYAMKYDNESYNGSQ